jgi:glutamyl-tRNA reductase
MSDSEHIEHYAVVGINHWSAQVAIREKFALKQQTCKLLLQDARMHGIGDLLVITTCNRTELLTLKENTEQVIRLFLRYTRGTRQELTQYGFQKQGEEAIRHIYRVALGLDAQILGDLQIINQVKKAYHLAAETGSPGSGIHRLMQSVFRAHKRSRNETQLASGAASIAYAAVQCAKKRLGKMDEKKIVLIGAGKIGKIACKNLVSAGARNVTLVNRSRDRAFKLGERFEFAVECFSRLLECVADADLVIVATGADKPVITRRFIERIPHPEDRRMVMIDLSVPRNIDPSLKNHAWIELIHIDKLNDISDETFQKRRESIPLVEQIIEQEIREYREWLNERDLVPTIRALVDKMDKIRRSETELYHNRITNDDWPKVDHLTRRIVNKILAHSIEHLKSSRKSDMQAAPIVASMFKLEVENG